LGSAGASAPGRGRGRRQTRDRHPDAGAVMLSRAADAIYWIGRYIERAESVARFIDVNLNLALDLPPGTQEQWKPLVGTTGDLYQGKPASVALDDIEWSAVLQSASGLELYRKRHGRLMKERIVEFLLLDREFPRSVHFCLVAAEEALHEITGTAIGTFRIPAE